MSDEIQFSDRGKRPLFYAPFFRDWTVLLGLFGVLAGSIRSATNYGYFGDFNSYTWAALSIELLFVIVVQGLVFAFLPATIRRRRLSKSASGTTEIPSTAIGTFWGLALLVAVTTTTLMIAQEGQRPASRSAIAKECVPKGADTLCVSGQFIGDKQIQLSYQWRYAQARSVEGFDVGAISWFVLLNCSYQTHTVFGLRANDPSGLPVEISESARGLMTAGLETDGATTGLVSQCQLLE